jgi:hypothetical protein
MTRSEFLKSLLGAVVVTTLPVPMFAQIVKADEATPKQNRVLTDGFWLFDNQDNLLAVSTQFDIHIIPRIIDTSSYSASPYREFTAGKPEYRFTVFGIDIVKAALKSIDSFIDYKTVIVKGNERFYGNVIATCVSQSFNEYETPSEVEFVLNGALTHETI